MDSFSHHSYDMFTLLEGPPHAHAGRKRAMASSPTSATSGATATPLHSPSSNPSVPTTTSPPTRRLAAVPRSPVPVRRRQSPLITPSTLASAPASAAATTATTTTTAGTTTSGPPLVSSSSDVLSTHTLPSPSVSPDPLALSLPHPALAPPSAASLPNSLPASALVPNSQQHAIPSPAAKQHVSASLPGSKRSTPLRSHHAELAAADARPDRRSSHAAMFSHTPPEQEEHHELEEVHPLQGEIQRLIAACDQHELKFRSSKASFEHRVFSEFPNILIRLSELDQRADKTAGDMYSLIHEAVPAFQARLDKINAERLADVETMRERTTPWRLFLDPEDSEEDDDDDEGPKDAAADNNGLNKPGTALTRTTSGTRRRRIDRVRGAGADPTDADALAMIERWAEEVEMNLTDEIVRLKAQLGEENRKRVIVFRLAVILAGAALIILTVVWILHRRHRARAKYT